MDTNIIIGNEITSLVPESMLDLHFARIVNRSLNRRGRMRLICCNPMCRISLRMERWNFPISASQEHALELRELRTANS
jgi:hypothetical protein